MKITRVTFWLSFPPFDLVSFCIPLSFSLFLSSSSSCFPGAKAKCEAATECQRHCGCACSGYCVAVIPQMLSLAVKKVPQWAAPLRALHLHVKQIYSHMNVSIYNLCFVVLSQYISKIDRQCSLIDSQIQNGKRWRDESMIGWMDRGVVLSFSASIFSLIAPSVLVSL